MCLQVGGTTVSSVLLCVRPIWKWGESSWKVGIVTVTVEAIIDAAEIKQWWTYCWPFCTLCRSLHEPGTKHFVTQSFATTKNTVSVAKKCNVAMCRKKCKKKSKWKSGNKQFGSNDQRRHGILLAIKTFTPVQGIIAHGQLLLLTRRLWKKTFPWQFSSLPFLSSPLSILGNLWW